MAIIQKWYPNPAWSKQRGRESLKTTTVPFNSEQDADVVCLLHREEYYRRGEEDWVSSNPDKAGMAEFIIAKQRNGPTGLVKLKWNRELTRFEDDSPYSGRAGSEIEANPGQSAYTADEYADEEDEAADVPF